MNIAKVKYTTTDRSKLNREFYINTVTIAPKIAWLLLNTKTKHNFNRAPYVISLLKIEYKKITIIRTSVAEANLAIYCNLILLYAIVSVCMCVHAGLWFSSIPWMSDVFKLYWVGCGFQNGSLMYEKSCFVGSV